MEFQEMPMYVQCFTGLLDTTSVVLRAAVFLSCGLHSSASQSWVMARYAVACVVAFLW